MRKINKTYKNIIYTIICFLILNLVKASVVTVSNRDELINGFSKASDKSINELTINIDDVTIELFDKLEIKSNVKKLYITGKSKESSILKFNNTLDGLFFYNNIFENKPELKISSLTITGTTEFYSFLDIKFEDVIINGSAIFDKTNRYIWTLDKKNENSDYIKKELTLTTSMTRVTFNTFASSEKYCINLYGNVIINDSKFYSHDSCLEAIIDYRGENKHTFSITNSYFDGIYKNRIIILFNSAKASVDSSTFENGYSEGGGSAMYIYYSGIIEVKNCVYKNFYTELYGGLFHLQFPQSFSVDHIDAYNTTAVKGGSIDYINSVTDNKIYVYLSNVNVYGSGMSNNSITYNGYGALISDIRGNIDLYISNFYGEELDARGTVGLFVMIIESNMFIENIELRKIYAPKFNTVLVYATGNQQGSKLSITNGTFIDIYQDLNNVDSRQVSAAMIQASKDIIISLKNCYFENLNFFSSMFVYTLAISTVIMENVYVNGYHLDIPSYFLLMVNGYEQMSTVLLKDVIVANADLDSFILCEHADITFRNLTFSNNCNENTQCGYYGSIIDYEEFSNNINIIDSTFDNLQGYYGFRIMDLKKYNIVNTKFLNCNYRSGLIYVNYHEDAKATIENSYFENNYGENGSIFYIYSVDKNYDDDITINNSVFKNNTASYFGGVIYIPFEFDVYNNYSRISFNNCEFINNTARKGCISYTYRVSDEPYFSNYDDLLKVENSIVTNPSHIDLISSSVDSIELLSGETINNEIYFAVMDDHGNIIDDSIKIINDLISFKMEINDTYNAKILSQSGYYCEVGSCEVPPLKIVGNPGNYELIIKLLTFGNYRRFERDEIRIDLTIKECNNSTYLYQDIENIGLKSCYLPECNPSCNKGDCIGINVCDCSETEFIGPYCNDYYREKEPEFFDTLIIIISYILTVIAVFLIISIYVFRKEEMIKAASVEFLIIMLFGIIINNRYLLVLLENQNSVDNCVKEYLFKNVGFSLVFGCILVKTLRIFIIFENVRKHTFLRKRKTMYAIIFVILFYHLILTLLWVLFDRIEVVKKYDIVNGKTHEYNSCKYPPSHKISTIINLIIIFIELVLSYENRHVKQKFQESLTVPAYSYTVVTFLMDIISFEYGISHYLFNAIGMIINTVIILLFIYINKYYNIFFKRYKRYTTSIIMSSSNKSVKANNTSQRSYL